MTQPTPANFGHTTFLLLRGRKRYIQRVRGWVTARVKPAMYGRGWQVTGANLEHAAELADFNAPACVAENPAGRRLRPYRHWSSNTIPIAPL